MITRDFSMISIDVTGVSLSLLLTKVTDAQYRKRFRASYNTELGREFQRATVDGRKDCNLPCVLQRGIASVSLLKDCLARTETQVGSCARRAGGP